MTVATASRNPDERARLRSIAFLNWAHALDHFVLLIYPTVVIGLEVIYKRPYAELIALSTAAFVAFGVFSLPAGWLADRWSRRNMMAAFYIGCGLSLVGVAAAPNLVGLAVAMFALGVFAAIYHPVGMPMLLEASKAQGRSIAFNGVCGNLGAALAAGIAAAIASWFGWRAAFLVPAVVCVATGIAYVMLVAATTATARRRRKTTADVALSQRAAHDHVRALCRALALSRRLDLQRASRSRCPRSSTSGWAPTCRCCWSARSRPRCSCAARWRSSSVGRLVEWIRPLSFVRRASSLTAAARRPMGGQCDRHDADPGARRHRWPRSTAR